MEQQLNIIILWIGWRFIVNKPSCWKYVTMWEVFYFLLFYLFTSVVGLIPCRNYKQHSKIRTNLVICVQKFYNELVFWKIIVWHVVQLGDVRYIDTRLHQEEVPIDMSSQRAKPLQTRLDTKLGYSGENINWQVLCTTCHFDFFKSRHTICIIITSTQTL